MAFETPNFDRIVVNRAGDAVAGYVDAMDWFDARPYAAVDVVDNWRAAHNYPLNTFQMALRNRSRNVDAGALVAQRSKRIQSIRIKLQRMPTLKLSDMQDVAGCRAIVSTVDQVAKLAALYEAGYAKHTCRWSNDYISRPKSDGYRGYHLIFCYDESDEKWGGLNVEIQLRTQLMHCWATAVETVDVFLREGLKQHRGSASWARFFMLMSNVIALKENCPTVRDTPRVESELRQELRQLDATLDGVAHRLRAFRETLVIAESQGTVGAGVKHIILSRAVDPHSGRPTLNWYGFPAGARGLEEANSFVAAEEGRGNDAVRVSVSDASRMRAAFPNYYSDAEFFCTMLEQFID